MADLNHRHQESDAVGLLLARMWLAKVEILEARLAKVIACMERGSADDCAHDIMLLSEPLSGLFSDDAGPGAPRTFH